jgi:hypothetical protein
MKVKVALMLIAFSITIAHAQTATSTEPFNNGGGNQVQCQPADSVSGLQIGKDANGVRWINVWCSHPATTKICAPFVPNQWRTVTPVPNSWTLDDCRNMGQAVGASTLQVGCFFDTVPPGQTQKYVFGGSSGIANPPSNANQPSPNCGW